MGFRPLVGALALAFSLSLTSVAAAAVPAPSQTRSLKITYTGSMNWTATSTMRPCDAEPGDSQCWHGTATLSETNATWTSAFEPIVIDHPASSFTGVAMTPSEQFFADQERGTGTFWDGQEDNDCLGTGTVGVAPNGETATVTVTATGPQSAIINAQPPQTLAPMTYNYNCTFAIPGPDPHWPQIATVSATVSADDLSDADNKIAIPSLASNPASYHPPSDCTAEAHAGTTDVQSCSLAFSGQGQIELQPVCGTAIATPGDGGQPTTVTFAPGDVFTSDSDGTTLNFGGGAKMDLEQGATLTADDDCFSFVADKDTRGEDVKSGSVWSVINCLFNCVAMGIVQAATGQSFAADHADHAARAAAATPATFTLTASAGKQILHVISGGVVLTSTYNGLKVNAGQTLALTPSGGHAATTNWPAAAQKVVPASQKPPAIAKLKLSGKKTTFTLSEAAKLVLKLVKGKRTLVTKKANGHKGKNAVSLGKRPPRGTTLVLSATDSGGRVTVVQKRA